MSRVAVGAFRRWQHVVDEALRRVEFVALFPILALAAYASGGPKLILAAALVLPTLLALQTFGLSPSRDRRHRAATTLGETPLADKASMLGMMARIRAMPNFDSACFVLEVDDWAELERQLGAEAAQDVLDECTHRLRAALRGDDLIATLGPARYGIVLHPIAAARLNIREGIANRLCATLGAAIPMGEARLRLTACVGHLALSSTANHAEDILDGAERALRDAQVSGPGSIRAYVPGRAKTLPSTDDLANEVPGALASGAIVPWFQPQIAAQNGDVTGFEALARWNHPTLGVLGPARLLPAIEAAGRMEDFGACIRHGAIKAALAWDRAGHAPLKVSVNAEESDLRSPHYADYVAWDLDAMGLAPERMTVEILETVAADTRDDRIMATLAALRSQGLSLDLDDFGVGQASLLSIRRFGVGRIKLDRSFVRGIDQDAELQAMVGGIVSLASKMGMLTVAEGVETAREQATLTTLGCAFLQGFGVAKPMPLEDTFQWLDAREDRTLPLQDLTARQHPAP